MVKPNINFTDGLENLLARVWQVNGEHLDDSYIEKTREAVIDVRSIYRNKGEKLIGEKIRRYSQSIDFSQKRYRAGYIASFGQRHAYLSYYHLKNVEKVEPTVIPEPKNGELTVTIVGAGAALELFGLCYYYNERLSRIRKLKINCIERINDWESDRDAVLDKIINKAFRKLRINKENIHINLVQDNISILSQKYDILADTDIIMVYNVLNEITSSPPSYLKMVWRNLEFILKICNKRVLLLLMEPSAKYTLSRIEPITDRLSICTKIILKSDIEEFVFDSDPLKIELGGPDGLNTKLFTYASEIPTPSFENSLKRSHMACIIDPLSPVSWSVAERQFRSARRERDEKQRFSKSKQQPSFDKLIDNFGVQKITKKYFNES